jgi:hypothetical protein
MFTWLDMQITACRASADDRASPLRPRGRVVARCWRERRCLAGTPIGFAQRSPQPPLRRLTNNDTLSSPCTPPHTHTSSGPPRCPSPPPSPPPLSPRPPPRTVSCPWSSTASDIPRRALPRLPRQQTRTRAAAAAALQVSAAPADIAATCRARQPRGYPRTPPLTTSGAPAPPAFSSGAE